MIQDVAGDLRGNGGAAGRNQVAVDAINGLRVGAIERNEPWGVWGGEIFDRGVVIARKRPRGRPRKADREVAA